MPAITRNPLNAVASYEQYAAIWLKEAKTERELFVVVQTQGASRDTLTLDAKNYAPVTLVRVGNHGGTVQELLHETFHEVTLGGPLPESLFRWTPEDEARG